MAEWARRQYTKGEIDRAGAALVPWWKTGIPPKPDVFEHAFDVLFNWRASHGMPLNVFQSTLRARAEKIEPNVVVAQRLKRLSSIMNKLVREENMKLSQMQDLGGCRAILSDVGAVRRLYQMYEDGQAYLPISEGMVKCYNYVDDPKDDGYRGVHVVGRYHARTGSRQPWNGQRIEIQIRTRLMHAFATAVETVTTFTREPLKFGAGPLEWRRFFSLMGSALALEEGTRPVPGTPGDGGSLVAELRQAAEDLRVKERLTGWSDVLRALPRKQITPGFNWLLLVLDTDKNTVNVTGYLSREQADAAIAKIEESRRENIDAVLVWVSSVKRLRVAYPNYYADTREFLKALGRALSVSTP